MLQNLALLLLLIVTASMIFSFEAAVFAQESTDESVEEETTEETSDEEVMDEEMSEEMMEDEFMEEEMMEDAMDSVITSPLKQLMSGIDPHEIQCREGQVLVFKASNWRPSCVNESSLEILSARGWVASHDPTHEDLTKMQDDYISEHTGEEAMEEETMEETEDEEQIEIEEDVVMEEETSSNGTDTETEGETEQQSYTIELREDMSMSSQ